MILTQMGTNGNVVIIVVFFMPLNSCNFIQLQRKLFIYYVHQKLARFYSLVSLTGILFSSFELKDVYVLVLQTYTPCYFRKCTEMSILIPDIIRIKCRNTLFTVHFQTCLHIFQSHSFTSEVFTWRISTERFVFLLLDFKYILIYELLFQIILFQLIRKFSIKFLCSS